MGTKIRKNGQWVDLELNNANSPDRLDGNWTAYSYTNRNYRTLYTNNTGKLLYVSVLVQLYSHQQWGNNIETHRDIAGGSVWGWVSTPNSTSTTFPAVSNVYQTTTGDFTNVCRVRDNGTNAASFLFLNSRFFVPPDCKYCISVHDSGQRRGSTENYTNMPEMQQSSQSPQRIIVQYWNEFEIDLAYPDNNFTSLDPNSNNFQRSAKVSSSTINSSWSQFMKDYAVWHEPGNYAVLDSQTYYSTTYTINITKAGDYTLEYAMDDTGYITFDGTTVAQTVFTSGGLLGDKSADPPDSVAIQNVTLGSHTLVANIKNSSSYPGQTSSTWNASPAGIAWRLKPFGT